MIKGRDNEGKLAKIRTKRKENKEKIEEKLRRPLDGAMREGRKKIILWGTEGVGMIYTGKHGYAETKSESRDVIWINGVNPISMCIV